MKILNPVFQQDIEFEYLHNFSFVSKTSNFNKYDAFISNDSFNFLHLFLKDCFYFIIFVNKTFFFFGFNKVAYSTVFYDTQIQFFLIGFCTISAFY